MDKSFLPYGRQWIDDDDIEAVVAVLKGNWLTTGPTVVAFEAAFAEKVGATHAVAVSSGTAALHLAAMALGLGPGDAIVVPAITFMATANAARYVGADVVFSDVDPDTGLMGEADLDRALAGHGGNRVRAIFPVHLGGQTVDMPGLASIAEKSGLAIVDDACHAIGTQCRSGGGDMKMVGSLSESVMSVFSLHPVKTITMGEGGVITTADGEMAGHLRRLRSHGIERRAETFTDAEMAFDETGAPNPWYYEMPELGFNYRASDLNCALGLSQLGKLDRFAERRRALALRYDGALAPLAPLLRPAGRVPGCDPVMHLYAVLINFAAAGQSRAKVMNWLAEKGIGTQVHYIPVPRLRYYQKLYGIPDLPGADAYYDRCLSLPLYPGMKDGDVDRVVAALADVLGAG